LLVKDMASDLKPNASSGEIAWDHGTHQDFFDYYAEASQSAAAQQRFRTIQTKLLRLAGSALKMLSRQASM
jgi:hypothetical protein